MKERMLVMNGQRIIQVESAGTWGNKKVDKAGDLKPGIYNFFSAVNADKEKSHSGIIIHSDNVAVYQQVGKTMIRHSRSDIDALPTVGTVQAIAYNQTSGKAELSSLTEQSTTKKRTTSL